MATELWQAIRPKGRSPLWVFHVIRDDAVIFDSAWVSVHYRSREDAAWLAELIDDLAQRGAFLGCPGHAVRPPPPLHWDGDLNDDCSASFGELYAHAEHLSGPVRGGNWYCSVSRAGKSLFHTADYGIALVVGRRPGGFASWSRWQCRRASGSRSQASPDMLEREPRAESRRRATGSGVERLAPDGLCPVAERVRRNGKSATAIEDFQPAVQSLSFSFQSQESQAT